MSVRRWCVMVVLSCVSLLPRAARAEQQEIARQQIPPNVEAGLLTTDMVALMRRSDTFRAQCARVAAEPRVRIAIAIVNTLESGRAQTIMRRDRSGAVAADVEVLFGEDYRELLGHEFEHVLELMDGVNLRQEAAAGRAWRLPGGAFETRRAFATGVQVRSEAETRATAVWMRPSQQR